VPGFNKTSVGDRSPFGQNEYRRSTSDLKYDSFTVAASTVRSQTIDGVAGQKILQPGTVLAKITSGGEAGKVGPFVTGATDVADGRQTLANIVGVNDTFLPWQLAERDVEVAVCYEGTLVQAWCIEYAGNLAATTEGALSNTTAAACFGAGAATKSVSLLFK